MVRQRYQKSNTIGFPSANTPLLVLVVVSNDAGKHAFTS